MLSPHLSRSAVVLRQKGSQLRNTHRFFVGARYDFKIVLGNFSDFLFGKTKIRASRFPLISPFWEVDKPSIFWGVAVNSAYFVWSCVLAHYLVLRSGGVGVVPESIWRFVRPCPRPPSAGTIRNGCRPGQPRAPATTLENTVLGARSHHRHALSAPTKAHAPTAFSQIPRIVENRTPVLLHGLPLTCTK